MRKQLIKLVLTCGLFIILFNPPLLPINSMHIVGTISILALFISVFSGRKIDLMSNSIFSILGYISILLIMCLNELVHQCSLNNIFMPIYFLIDIIPFSICLKLHGDDNSFKIEDYFKLSRNACLIQAILVILALIFPNVKELFYTILSNYGYLNVNMLYKHRMFGLSGGLQYATPVLLGIMSILSVYNGLIGKKINYVYAVLLFFAAFINARISIIVIVIGIVAILLDKNLRLRKKTVFLVCILLFYFFIMPLLLQIVNLINSNTFDWIESGIEELKGVLNGDYSGVTVKYLTSAEKYRLPEGLAFIFGNGYYVMGNSTYATDIGFINDIWYGGVVYAIIKYIFYYILIYRCIQRQTGVARFLFCFYAILLPFLNIKGIAFMMNDFINFLIIIIITSDKQSYIGGKGKNERFAICYSASI